MKTKVNTIEELKALIEKEIQLHVADIVLSDQIELHPVGEFKEKGFAYVEYEEGIFELHNSEIASVVYLHDIYYVSDIEVVKGIVAEWINEKIIGSFTTTEGRSCTEMLEGKWESLHKVQEGYDILSDNLSEQELSDQERWFDIEAAADGRRFATTGTSDLEYYIEIK